MNAINTMTPAAYNAHRADIMAEAHELARFAKELQAHMWSQYVQGHDVCFETLARLCGEMLAHARRLELDQAGGWREARSAVIKLKALCG